MPPQVSTGRLVLLAHRVVASAAAGRKFDAASAPGAVRESFDGMGEVQFEALQKHPDSRLQYVRDPAVAADYTPAGPAARWCAALHHLGTQGCPLPIDAATMKRFDDKESLLRDRGPQAITAEARRLWSMQYKQPPAEGGKEKGDPASCKKHYAGDDTTLTLPPNCMYKTRYVVCAKDDDPHAPPELPTTQSTAFTVLLAGRHHETRATAGAAAVAASGSDAGGGEHKRQRRAEPAAADAPSPET